MQFVSKDSAKTASLQVESAAVRANQWREFGEGEGPGLFQGDLYHVDRVERLEG